jgi:hypothetical protein
VAKPIVVHQMGKVGSTSVRNSLKALRLDVPVHHSHELAEAVINRPAELWHRQLLRHLDGRHAQGRWHIITMVRDPVARNCSSYFHNLTKPHYVAYLPELADGGQVGTAELLSNFLVNADHDFAVQWFDHEILRLFGLDVFAEPFPHEQGYAIYRDFRVDVLLLRFEQLPDTFTTALEEFIGIAGVPLVRANDSQHAGYRRFLREAALPASYLDRMYSSKLARHFYTADELATFRAGWTR